jgi:hypothetical protein
MRVQAPRKVRRVLSMGFMVSRGAGTDQWSAPVSGGQVMTPGTAVSCW